MLRAIVIIETLLVVLLVFAFRAELITTATRAYLAFKENPSAERRIGDYYYTAAKTQTEYANIFYNRAYNSFKLRLANNPPAEQIPHLKMGLGRMNECGMGVKQDLTEAKRWYEEAIQADGGKNPQFQESLDRVKAYHGNGPLPSCDSRNNEQYYMQWQW